MLGSQLQTAIYSALTNASPSIAGGRVYDRVPGSPTFPYISIGDEQVIDDGNTCDDGWEVFPDVHIWSRSTAGSKLEIKGIIAQVVPAVVGISSISGSFTVIAAQLETARTFRDPDGLTEHAVCSFRFVIIPSA